jgi:hypothetical protein
VARGSGRLHRALTRPQPFPGCVALETKSNQPGRFQKLRIFKGLKKAEPADADTAISAPERCPLDMTRNLALIKNERCHEYRRRLIAVENRGAMRRWRSSLAGRRARPSLPTILGATGDGRGEAVWGSASGVLAITRGPESKMSAALSGRRPVEGKERIKRVKCHTLDRDFQIDHRQAQSNKTMKPESM